MATEGKTVKCEKCGGEYTFGDFPFCSGDPKDHGRWMTADQPCEEFVDEMCDTEPRRFSSTREWVRFLDKNNIIPREKKDKRTMDNEIKGDKRLFFDMKR